MLDHHGRQVRIALYWRTVARLQPPVQICAGRMTDDGYCRYIGLALAITSTMAIGEQPQYRMAVDDPAIADFFSH